MELVRHFEDAAKEVFASDKMSEEMQLSWQSLQVGVSDLESENIDLNVRVQDYEDYIEKLLGDLEERKQEIANLEQSFRESVDMLKILQKKSQTQKEEHLAEKDVLQAQINALKTKLQNSSGDASSFDVSDCRGEERAKRKDQHLRLRNSLRSLTTQLVDALLRLDSDAEQFKSVVDQILVENREDAVRRGVIVNPPTDHRKRRGAGGQQGPNFVFGRPSSRHSVHVTIEDGNEEEETSSQPRLEQDFFGNNLEEDMEGYDDMDGEIGSNSECAVGGTDSEMGYDSEPADMTNQPESDDSGPVGFLSPGALIGNVSSNMVGNTGSHSKDVFSEPVGQDDGENDDKDIDLF